MFWAVHNFPLPWQTGTWKSLAKICEEHNVHKKYKTAKQQKKFVTEVLKLQITLDDKKEEGVVFGDTEEGIKQVKVGRRLSHAKVQKKGVETKEELEAAALKSADAVDCPMAAQDWPAFYTYNFPRGHNLGPERLHLSTQQHQNHV